MTTTDKTVLKLDDTFASEFPELGADWQPQSVPAPELVALNLELAKELGIDPAKLESPNGLATLTGNAAPADARPIAMAYAGHQFGGFSPLLGDGRAVLLGEFISPEGHRLDIHLKGSGRTPFARGGDGKAALAPMFREFLMAEAMHALNISTTRALAVATTGEQIRREEGLVPGAVLTRVASSHIRVGTFQFAARLQDQTVLQRLADHAIERHYPAVAASDRRYLAFLEAVIDAQASLIADWMLVGFIHGVMNTDNVTISGETIDYGPCAFMDRYDPATVYSSIDHGARYAYGNQPAIGQWNLVRLAETLLPLIDEDVDAAVAAATEVLNAYADRYQHHWLSGMRTKLGLVEPIEADEVLVADLLTMLQSEQVDYTTTFRALAGSLRGDDKIVQALFDAQPLVQAWFRWLHCPF
ncbi:UNVERIFIED_CONTAM: hypothetical protein GTU68_013791 [Idotea baltica]|nr:hypothetical protein [Idotea baltica]